MGQLATRTATSSGTCGRCASTMRTDAPSSWSGSWSGRGADRSSEGRTIGREATLDRTSTSRFFFPYSPEECVEQEFSEVLELVGYAGHLPLLGEVGRHRGILKTVGLQFLYGRKPLVLVHGVPSQ